MAPTITADAIKEFIESLLTELTNLKKENEALRAENASLKIQPDDKKRVPLLLSPPKKPKQSFEEPKQQTTSAFVVRCTLNVRTIARTFDFKWLRGPHFAMPKSLTIGSQWPLRRKKEIQELFTARDGTVYTALANKNKMISYFEKTIGKIVIGATSVFIWGHKEFLQAFNATGNIAIVIIYNEK